MSKLHSSVRSQNKTCNLEHLDEGKQYLMILTLILSLWPKEVHDTLQIEKFLLRV